MKTVYSVQKSAEEVVRDIQSQLSGFDLRSILFFASSAFDPHVLSLKMQEGFPEATTFGCSTAGEIVSGKMLKQSVVAMAFGSQVLDTMKVVVIEDIRKENGVSDAFATFEAFSNERMLDMDHEKYVGIILADGLSAAEEMLIEKIGDHTNVPFIGGSAGDDLQFKSTYVFAEGKAYTNAAVLALLKPKVGFDIIKTQSFRALDKQLTARKVNEAGREVIQFDEKPAAMAYAEALGISVQDAPKHFMHNPVGLMVDGEPYVRSPQQIKGESMVFYCNVKEGMQLSMLESTDIVQDTQKAVELKKQELGDIAGIINFNCILRTLELEDKGQTEAYAKIFKDIPTIGFSTYGEQYIGHINQTSTMLLFRGNS